MLAEARKFYVLQNVLISYEVHPISCSIGTGFFSGGEAARI
jgi:hypothetical protein